MGWTADAVAAQAADNVVMPNDDRPADLAHEAAAQELLRRGLDRDAVALALRTIRRDLDLDTSRPEEASMSITHADVDLEAVKARQQGMWASGNYAVIGTTLQITEESLCEAVDVQAGERVLDVAAGNGNAALAAARRGCEVTASDYVATVLEATKARATSEGLDIDCRQADAEALPFPQAAFDVVLSTFGVMFAANQEQAAAELLRVSRPGGRIGLANWTPTGFIGQMLKIVGRHAPPQAGVRSPLEWGTQLRLAQLFGDDTTIDAQARHFIFRYRSPKHWLDSFRRSYGPMHKAFAAIDPETAANFERELLDLAETHNNSTTALRIPSEYLEVIATKVTG
jgi:ubiquinone/menaquinone biosynthesis C-methylase UbiE